MIKRIAQKLKSHTGATIVFAMAVFVLVSIVSVSMLTVPLNAAASGKTQKDNEQIRLALASAAGLLRDSIVDTKLSYAWEWGPVDTQDDEIGLSDMLSATRSKAPKNTEDTTSETYFSSGLPSLVKELVKSVATSGTEQTISLTITLQDAALAAKLPPVTAELTMDKEYNLTAKFTVTTNSGSYSITHYFGMSVITPYRMDKTQHVKKEEVEGEEEGKVKITYSYEGHWELSWPLDNYWVSA